MKTFKRVSLLTLVITSSSMLYAGTYSAATAPENVPAFASDMQTRNSVSILQLGLTATKSLSAGILASLCGFGGLGCIKGDDAHKTTSVQDEALRYGVGVFFLYTAYKAAQYALKPLRG